MVIIAVCHLVIFSFLLLEIMAFCSLPTLCIQPQTLFLINKLSYYFLYGCHLKQALKYDKSVHTVKSIKSNSGALSRQCVFDTQIYNTKNVCLTKILYNHTCQQLNLILKTQKAYVFGHLHKNNLLKKGPSNYVVIKYKKAKIPMP